jgi:LDH2 family malate/lactate/ureidoglycolate dehydrogenase
MKLDIKKATKLSNDILQSLGLDSDEAILITENLIEAELVAKKTHGLVRLTTFKSQTDDHRINTDKLDLDVISQTDNSLYIDGHHKIGMPIIYESLDIAFEKIRRSKVVCVGLKDIGVSGYIGAYARKATEQNLIFLGFHNSPGGLVPYGTIKEMWGTNPLTVGIPTSDAPVILDMASSQITWGDLLVAKNEKKQIKSGVAIDSSGEITTDPAKVTDGGGLLPFFGHKGSGLAFAVELLAGALTGSRVGNDVSGGWGSFYILIDPTMFRSLPEFTSAVETAIKELKNAPKAKGFKEVFFAGEQSNKLREKHLSEGFFDVSDNLYQSLMDILNSSK